MNEAECFLYNIYWHKPTSAGSGEPTASTMKATFWIKAEKHFVGQQQ